MVISLMIDWISRMMAKISIPTHMICGKTAACT